MISVGIIEGSFVMGMMQDEYENLSTVEQAAHRRCPVEECLDILEK